MNRTIQIIFAVFALVMLGLIVWWITQDAWSPINWGMLSISAVCCLLVFKNFLYVFNFSYSLAAICNGLLLMVMLPSPATYVLAGAAILYGLRLASYSWIRQHSTSYSPRFESVTLRSAKMPMGVKVSLWLMPTLLYTFHLMAVYFAGLRGELSTGVMIGALAMVLGTLIEGTADAQKFRAKQRDVTRPITTGIFSRWRHPNYAGEILVQMGLLIAGLSSIGSFLPGLAVVLAPLYIIILMIYEAVDLDREQQQKYGKDPKFNAYTAASGSLLPKF